MIRITKSERGWAASNRVRIPYQPVCFECIATLMESPSYGSNVSASFLLTSTGWLLASRPRI